MKKSLFNIMSCSISVFIILLLLGFKFYEHSELPFPDRNSLSHNSPNHKMVKNEKKAIVNNKTQLEPIILPPPPPKISTRRQNKSDRPAETLPRKPMRPALAEANKSKSPSNKLKITKSENRILLIKPIKPAVVRRPKIKLVSVMLERKPSEKNADKLQPKTEKVLSKTKFKSGDHSQHLKFVQKARQTDSRPTVKTSSKTEGAEIVKILANGRALLRILEHGSGPDINFAWPDNENERDSLFVLLRKCFGMQTALLDQNKRLFRRSDTSGKPWIIDMDRISGFTRMAGGKLTHLEQKIIKQTRQQHSQIRLNAVVRMFPRKFDGGLLGELARFIGGNNTKISSISAQYKQIDQDLFMEDIRINGQRVAGKINLSPYSSCRKERGRV